ncbi:aromatic amino acid aminotransferase, putative [Talaromyces stipitatus ATCC 10500]|uniref:Aromatic amino acid aminotransferase, putative n=1 Tax=Talaromyces stipitatus (strain ATCC 10500 / CBS 375.48 / QM 6759 / NRRL 1006) TaxID=441959 RepID=B8MBK9_TALSN|nr:aromatic amino acid aminotransferase, putative [Talaromyces stipitatus ATCC 10500]EED17873.1 aromatic amino acid aminotransferase, putative [Talaromyces stipitatus ATCC 10500]
MAQHPEFRSSLHPPLDLSHHFSQTTKNRQSSNVKGLYKWFQIPGMQNVAGGLPHESYFPYDTLEAAAARPSRFDLPDSSKGKNNKPAEWHVTVPKIQDTTDILKKIDLSTALQYGTAEGYPPLAAFIRKLTRDHLHPNIPYAEGPEIIMSCGNTDGFGKVIEALTNPWNKTRDWIRDKEGVLFEEFAYMNAVQTVQPRGLNIVTVAVDADGMKASGPGGLADVLENWDFSQGRCPHLMYTVTLGQNPTGSTTSIERRKEIYALCQKYDIIIIEDEPYWNLQFPSSRKHAAKYRGDAVQADLFNRNYNAHGRSSGYEFLDSLVPSFLSIDVDGRVVRLDTFSKTIAPGCRLGWVTAQPAIIERIARITETSTQQPSGFVQVMVAQLLLQQQSSPAARKATDKDNLGWTLDGWIQWLEGLRDAYERRVHDMCSTLEEGRTVAIDKPAPAAKHRRAPSNGGLDSWSVVSKVPMYDFNWPLAGMFIWIKIRYDTHPLLEIYGAEKVCKALWLFLLEKPFLVLCAPGTMFAPTEAIRGRASKYLRLCFAPMAEDAVTDISQHFVAGCRAFWQLENFDDIPGLDDPIMPEMMGMQMC